MVADPSLRVVIVDDEPPALDRLRGAVNAVAGFVIVGEASDGLAGLELVAKTAPQIIIVDIEMPGLSGLELVRRLDPSTMPAVIFATAYDQHALEAFDLGAADFVTKPIDYDRMRVALARARTTCESERREELTAALLRQVDTLRARLGEGDGGYMRDIWVQKRSEFRRINVEEIDFLQAERDFVRIFARGTSYLLRQTLAGLEARLDPSHFMRIHRSHVVNMVKPLTLHRTLRGGLAARVEDGTILPVGRSYVRILRDRLDLPRT